MITNSNFFCFPFILPIFWFVRLAYFLDYYYYYFYFFDLFEYTVWVLYLSEFYLRIPHPSIYVCSGKYVFKVMLVLPLPDPDKPEQHEPWCPLGKPAWVLTPEM